MGNSLQVFDELWITSPSTKEVHWLNCVQYICFKQVNSACFHKEEKRSKSKPATLHIACLLSIQLLGRVTKKISAFYISLRWSSNFILYILDETLEHVKKYICKYSINDLWKFANNIDAYNFLLENQWKLCY